MDSDIKRAYYHFQLLPPFWRQAEIHTLSPNEIIVNVNGPSITPPDNLSNEDVFPVQKDKIVGRMRVPRKSFQPMGADSESITRYLWN